MKIHRGSTVFVLWLVQRLRNTVKIVIKTWITRIARSVASTATTTLIRVIVEHLHENGFALSSHLSRQDIGQISSYLMGARMANGFGKRSFGTQTCDVGHQEQGLDVERHDSQFGCSQHLKKRSGSEWWGILMLLLFMSSGGAESRYLAMCLRCDTCVICQKWLGRRTSGCCDSAKDRRMPRMMKPSPSHSNWSKDQPPDTHLTTQSNERVALELTVTTMVTMSATTQIHQKSSMTLWLLPICADSHHFIRDTSLTQHVLH